MVFFSWQYNLKGAISCTVGHRDLKKSHCGENLSHNSKKFEGWVILSRFLGILRELGPDSRCNQNRCTPKPRCSRTLDFMLLAKNANSEFSEPRITGSSVSCQRITKKTRIARVSGGGAGIQVNELKYITLWWLTWYLCHKLGKSYRRNAYGFGGHTSSDENENVQRKYLT